MLDPWQEAIAETTTSERLQELVHTQPDLALPVAQNFNAPADLLRELATHPDKAVRRQVAGHPNTPAAVLVQLAEEFPDSILDNLAFDLLFLEIPNFPEQLSDKALSRLLRRPKTPIAWLQWAANHSQPDVLLAVVMHPHTPHSTLDAIIQRYQSSPAHTELVTAAQLHVNWSLTLPDDWQEVVQTALRTTTLPQNRQALRELWQLGILPNPVLTAVFEALRLEFAASSKAPAASLAYLISDSASSIAIRKAIALNPATPIELLQSLLEDDHQQVRDAARANPNLPFHPSMQPQLSTARLLQQAQQPTWQVRILAAKHPQLPVAVLQRLAQDPEWQVRQAIAAHPKTPPSTLEELANDLYISVQEQAIATLIQSPHASPLMAVYNQATNSLASQETLQQLANHPCSLIRREVAQHPNTDERVLERLARDRRAEVRATVAQNPHTPPANLERLLDDQDSSVQFAVLANPRFPVERLQALANLHPQANRLSDDHPDHDNTPPLSGFTTLTDRQKHRLALAALQTLFQRGVAGTPRYLELFTSNKPSLSRLAVLLSPHAPASLLTRYTRSLSWLERCAIAQHPHTPAKALHLLSQDGNRIVRTLANQQLQHQLPPP